MHSYCPRSVSNVEVSQPCKTAIISMSCHETNTNESKELTNPTAHIQCFVYSWRHVIALFTLLSF